MNPVPLPYRETPTRLRAKGTDDPCVVCGRAVVTATAGQVHVVAGRGVAHPTDDTDYGNADQGWYSIGPDCARRLPAGYVVTGADRFAS